MIQDITTGVSVNSLVQAKDVLEEVQRLDSVKQDLLAPRRSVAAIPSQVMGGIALQIGSDNFHPTRTGLAQLAELSGVPKNFLMETERKYPELAAQVLNTWFQDDDIVNRKRKHPVLARDLKQLFRCYRANGTPGVLRAVRSDRYRIMDNSDVAACVLSAIRDKDEVGVQGAINDDRFRLLLTNWSLKRELKKVGEPVSFRVRVTNSETGYASLSVIPQVVILTCLNGATVGKDLVHMHLGGRLSHESLLSSNTLRLKNEAFFAEVRDVIGSIFSERQIDKLVAQLDENLGQEVPDSKQAIEVVSKQFGIDEEAKASIFAEFIGHQEPNRFGLSQAITTVAHNYEQGQYEKAVELEDAGGKILTMNPREFEKMVAV